MTPNVPFSEPPWLDSLPSPYHTSSHKQWQAFCREYFAEHLSPHALDWEREEQVPKSVYKTFAQSNMLIPNLPAPLPVTQLKSLGIHSVGPVRVEDFDYVHTAIYVAESKRATHGLGGPASAIQAGFRYGLPPILKFGSDELQRRVVPAILSGDERVCIAITEPDAGSDVASVKTSAIRSQDGKFFVVNGSKKWITNGLFSDWATMCVRTGGKGPGGLSVLLVPLKAEGVKMRRIHVSGQHASGTTFIELDDVKVPVENLIGEEGKGMNYIMTNFNHERLTIAIGTVATARVALTTAFEYVMKREAFGKPLIEQPVVRHRLAKAGAELETIQAWVDQIVYQMCHLSKTEADKRLGGISALAKAKAAMVFNECAQTAQLLMGGNAYTRTGQGEIVERLAREVAAARIPGGSEDVLLDLAIRQLYKNYQRDVKAKI